MTSSNTEGLGTGVVFLEVFQIVDKSLSSATVSRYKCCTITCTSNISVKVTQDGREEDSSLTTYLRIGTYIQEGLLGRESLFMSLQSEKKYSL